MHKRLSKAIAASLMAVTMVAPAVANVVPMGAFAGQVLGESTFDYKALPWHTCETSPAKQDFAIEDGAFHITVTTPKGGDGERWDLQFRHRNLNFKAGHTYKISFQAKAKRSGMELCSKISNIKGDEEYCTLQGGSFGIGPAMGGQWGSAVTLSTSYQTFSGTFTPTQDLEAVEWAFHYAQSGKFPGGNAQAGDEIWFDNMSIECTQCGDTIGEGSCNADPSNSFGAVNRDYSAAEFPEMKVDGKLVNYISVNQIGYYSNLAKIATLGDNQGDILHGASKITLDQKNYEFELVKESDDSVVYTGTTGDKFYDADSDDNVCKIDFSEYTTPGRYYLRIKDKGWRSFAFNIGDNIYSDDSHDLLTNSMNYFYQNRSGIDIKEAYITSGDKSTLAHEGGHKTDTASVQKIWKNEYASKDEATGTYASSKITANGGWYDAGDHGKYVVNGGIAVWTLQNMYERAIQTEEGKAKFADGSGTVVIPETNNGIPDVLDEAAVELDWMTDMVVKADEPTWGQYAGMVYHKLHDHKWTGLATRPYNYEEEWETVRIVKPPTFAATLNYAACAAQAARLWKPYDADKAAFYLEEAIKAYDAYKEHWYEADHSKTTHPTLKCDCEKEEINETSLYAPMWQAKGGGPYGDNEVKDDGYWAACEIFVSASEMSNNEASRFKAEVDAYKDAYKVTTRITGGENKDGSLTTFNWGNTASAGSLTLALHMDLLSESEQKTIKDSILEAANTYISTEEKQGYGIPYLYDGPGYNDPNNLNPSIIINGYEWGSNSMVINNCIVMAYAYDLTGEGKYMNGVANAMNYLLGCNPLSYSYITGYGQYKERNPHHRYWSYELDKTLPMAPDGILSGGPNAGLQDPYVRALGFVPGVATNPSQRCFVDSIEAWSTNEVTINWNAPLAWITSFLQDEAADADGLTDTPQPSTGDQGDTLWGDANDDGTVDIADATLILQVIGNGDKYKLSAQGAKNADVVDNGGGITAMDSLAVQMYDAKLFTQADFPTTSDKIG
ncbi:MAG: glycoside hydrolase family 9 protein [Ruminococcus sp.]|nr:glycoside hydrolase family 9 protein [Ruminococcus sp.]